MGGAAIAVEAQPRGLELERLALDTARISAALVLAGAVVAAIVAIAVAAPVRDLLSFGFGGIPDTLGEAWSIFVHNARVAIATLAAGAAVNGLWLREGDRYPGLRRTCDVLLGLVAGANVLVVGAAVGAYGGRMVGALLPHGPLEVLGFSVAGAMYLRARQGARPQLVVGAAGAALVVLAGAAVIEAYG